MKNMKKILVLAMCVAVLGSMTGCGNKNNTDMGTTNTTTEEKSKANQTDGVNGATNGTADKNNNRTDNNRTDNNGNGAIDNAVHDVTDGIDNIADDLTGNENRNDNTRDYNAADNTTRNEAGTDNNR